MMSLHYKLSTLTIERWATPVILLFFGLLTGLYALYTIPTFSSPLVNVVPGDVDQWEYMGYYVAHHLKFTPLPQVDWVNNETLYPYGTNHIFQGWAFESNMIYAICFRWFGAWGPWLNIYYVLSLFIGSAGAFLLLRFDYGLWRSVAVAALVSFFNFYALNKYPDHYAYALIHWTVLSVLTDFMLARRVVTNQRVSLRFLLLKSLLLMLCLGQDVGYVAGYALSSFTLNSLFITGWLGRRFISNRFQFLRYIRQTWLGWQKQWRRSPRLLVGLGATTVAVGLLYIPLLISMQEQVSSFTFADRFFGGHGWVNPIRIFLPYLNLPGLNALNNPFANVLRDMPEGDGSGSAGWFLLLIGIIGLVRTPARLRWAFAPLLIFCGLHAFYHPIHVPLLQVFPWCHLNRIPSRVTLIYPVVLAIFTLHWSPRLQPAVWLLVLGLGLAELTTVLSYRHNRPTYRFVASFQPYMNQLRQQPGEAVLDWPFCVIGGNGIGLGEGLCPLYKRTSTLYALQRFHGKKTMGQYFGRMHTSQLQPFVASGWPGLLNHPNETNALMADRLTTCLTTQEWRFFEQFYQYNDFSGVNLYVDLLPKSCVADFYRHLGRPVAQTELSGVGRVVFIPKTAAWRRQVNPKQGLAVRLPCNCTTNI
ncbi:MAG: hypothetical protein H7319_05255 [Spirosoma sp.]|nr:hypothetical protein [Spirosoma sp.]